MFSVNYENKEDVVVVRLSGELLLEEVGALKNSFNEQINSHNKFLLDFDEVSMIDSSGLGYVVYCLKELKKVNGELKLISLKDQAKLIFEITRVDSILDIHSSQTEALESFSVKEDSDVCNY